jgi:hypothetical protein
MAKVNLLTQKEYAEHRGCSAVAVHKAVKAGRISLIGDKIDPDVADIQWKRNTRARVSTRPPAQQHVAPAIQPATPDLVDAAGAGAPAPDGKPGEGGSDIPAGERGALQTTDPRYLESRSSREEAESRRAWLKLQEEEGALVRVDQVKAELAALLAPVREALMQLGARLAPLLAPQSDAGRIQTIIEAEMHQVLAPLGKAVAAQPPAEAGVQ